MNFNDIKNKLEPYRDIILFVVCLLGANLLWKLCIQADEHSSEVYLFSYDISAPFDYASQYVAKRTYQIVKIFRPTVHYFPPNTIYFDSGVVEKIVWACTAIKQGILWLIIMIFARGDWKRKLWFIPLGWVFIHIFNVLRITIISFIIEYHHELFDLFHSYILKYLFYFMMFMLWVWWVEKLAKPKSQATTANDEVADIKENK